MVSVSITFPSSFLSPSSSPASFGCKKLNDGILQAAEVNFASGRRTVVSGARAVSSARIVNGAEKKII